MSTRTQLPETWTLLTTDRTVSLESLTASVLKDLVPAQAKSNLAITLRKLGSSAQAGGGAWVAGAIEHLTWADRASTRGVDVLPSMGNHPLSLPYPIGVVLIEAPEQNPALQQATLEDLHRRWAASLSANDDLEMLRRIRSTGVLMVIVRGMGGHLPDLYAVAQREPGADAHGETERTYGVLRVLVDQAMQAAADGRMPRDHALQRALDPLANFVSATRSALQDPAKAGAWRGPFGAFDQSRAYDAFRGKLRATLEGVMTHIERSTGILAQDDAALAELREAASLVAFRVFFLVSIERRNLLYAAGRAPKYQFSGLTEAGAAAPESSFVLLQDLTAVIRGTPRSTGSRTRLDLAVRGASIFSNRPNEHFGLGLQAWLDALDTQTATIAKTPGVLRAWDALVADLALLATGQISRYAYDAERDATSDVSLGGSAHVQRILGDVYEQILAMVPVAEGTGPTRKVRLVAPGSAATRSQSAVAGASTAAVRAERKALGAHYTPESLVLEVVRAALEPAFAAAWVRARGDWRRYHDELLGLRVVDPAMGSAHFLTVAALEIAREMAWAEHCGKPRPADHFEYITKPNAWGEQPTQALAAMNPLAARYLARVAERCCHGVDLAPLAVELGKLALWQLTMVERALRGVADDTPPPSLTFLDANLRCGDSLLGAQAADVESLCRDFELEGAEGDLFNFVHASPKAAISLMRRLESLLSGPADALRAELRAARADIVREFGSMPDLSPDDDHVLRREVFGLLHTAKARYRWLWDLAFLRAWWKAQPKGGGDAALFQSLKPGTATSWPGLVGLGNPTPAQQRARGAISAQAKVQRAFHWELEFFDVFHRDAQGFDVVVANPPFLGDKDLRAARTEQGVSYLRSRYTGGNTPDLCGFFLLSFRERLSPSRGVAGTLGPNTIAQAKNRVTVLMPLVAGASPLFEIFRSCQTRVWPGDAAVHIATIHMRRAGCSELTAVTRRVVQICAEQSEPNDLESDNEDARQETTQPASTGTIRLNVVPLNGLVDCSFLDGGVETTLLELGEQANLAYTGMFPRGPFDRDLDFIARVPKGERHAIYAYLNNRDVQQQPRPVAQRVIIDVFDALVNVGLESAAPQAQESWLKANMPFLHGELKKTVFPVRNALPRSKDNDEVISLWWRFQKPRQALRAAWAGFDALTVVGRTGKHQRPTILSRTCSSTGLRLCLTEKSYIIPSNSRAVLSVFSSIFLEVITRRLCSTLKSDMNFAPSDVLPYFPFPWKGQPTGNEYVAPVLNPPADVEARLGPFAEALLKLREELLTEPTRHGLDANEFRGPTALYNAFDNPEDKRGAIEKLREVHRRLEAAVLAEYGWSDLAGPERWTFERPWIDGTWRYVPDLDTRREYLRRLEKLNHQLAAAARGAPAKADAPQKGKAAAKTAPAAVPTPVKAAPKPPAPPASKPPAPAPAKTVPPSPPSRVKRAVSPGQAIREAIAAADAPIGKAEILTRTGVAESEWNTVRLQLEADPEIVRTGAARGTRYTTRQVVADRLLELIAAAGSDGLRKSEALNALAELNIDIDDETWTALTRTLVADGRLTKSGQAKGTRYHAEE